MIETAYLCPTCDSSLVVHQGWAQWRVDTQQFELIKLSSNAICLKCESKFHFVAPVELTEDVILTFAKTTTKIPEEVT
jgi:DNA-directed RNA polymerase subunit RPC12/RpoP